MKVLVADLRPSVLVLADSAYDTNKLYAKVASYNGQLLTAFQKRASGKGHVRQSPARLAALEAWRGIGGYVYRKRWEIERIFGNQSAFGGGLTPLPAWVRTLPRVTRWIGAKLIIYHVRLKLKNAVKKAG